MTRVKVFRTVSCRVRHLCGNTEEVVRTAKSSPGIVRNRSVRSISVLLSRFSTRTPQRKATHIGGSGRPERVASPRDLSCTVTPLSMIGRWRLKNLAELAVSLSYKCQPKSVVLLFSGYWREFEFQRRKRSLLARALYVLHVSHCTRGLSLLREAVLMIAHKCRRIRASCRECSRGLLVLKVGCRKL